MKMLAILSLSSAQLCQYAPPVNPVDGGTGGSSPVIGTGGSISVFDAGPIPEPIIDASVEPEIEWPTCFAAQGLKAGIVKYKLGQRPAPRVQVYRSKPAIPIIQKSRLWSVNDFTASNQGTVGACTGFDAEGELSTFPFTRHISNKEAFAIYAEATRIDGFAGQWFTNGTGQDTGSDGFSAHQAAINLNLINTKITEVYTLNDIIDELQFRSGGMGGDWSTEMFTVDSDCIAHYNPKTVEGGHQWQMIGVQLEKEYIWGMNSWGQGYGGCKNKRCGYFVVTFADMGKLLRNYGQSVFFDVP